MWNVVVMASFAGEQQGGLIGILVLSVKVYNMCTSIFSQISSYKLQIHTPTFTFKPVKQTS